MTHTALAVASGLMCTLAGLRQASRLHQEETRLKRLASLLTHLAILLDEQAYPLPEAFLLCATDSGDADQLLRALAENLRLHPLTPLTALYDALHPIGPEVSLLRRCFTSISHGSADSRVHAARSAAEEVSLLAESAHQRAEKDARLFQTLGWVGGLCLTMMLL